CDFLPNSINVDVGETVTLSVENTGTVEHDLEIVDFNPDNVQQDDSHNHGQNANTIHLHATPGEKQTVSFTPSEKGDRKSTRLNSSHVSISYAVFCLKKKNKKLL